MYGRQCQLRLWHEVFNRENRPAPSLETQRLFDIGTQVGELARKRFAPGILVEEDHFSFEEARKTTRELLRDPTVEYIYEAAFVHRRVRVRTDILERLADGTWRLIEVKTVGKIRDDLVEDLAVQRWVAEGSGLKIADAGVLTLNTDYVRGNSLNLRKLFRYHSLNSESKRYFLNIRKLVERSKRTLAARDAPTIRPGEHCHTPYACPFLDSCMEGEPLFVHPVSDLPRSRKVVEVLRSKGIDEISKIPKNFELNPLHDRIRTAVVGNSPYISPSIAKELEGFKNPVRHLDFETVSYTIPKFIGTSPFEAIPFMFSVHTEQKAGEPLHGSYLHRESTDPRRSVAEALIDLLGHRGSICVYSSFEAVQLRKLKSVFEDLRRPLDAILDRIVDLHKIVRDCYYHPEFHGSFSLKSVYPVLADGDYGDLSIDNGSLAAIRYAEAMDSVDNELRESVFTQLEAYCARDTLATVEVKRALEDLASQRV